MSFGVSTTSEGLGPTRCQKTVRTPITLLDRLHTGSLPWGGVGRRDGGVLVPVPCPTNTTPYTRLPAAGVEGHGERRWPRLWERTPESNGPTEGTEGRGGGTHVGREESVETNLGGPTLTRPSSPPPMCQTQGVPGTQLVEGLSDLISSVCMGCRHKRSWVLRIDNLVPHR